MNRVTLLIIGILFLTTSPIYAQKPDIEKLVNEGIQFHDKGDYQSAIDVYKKALQIDPKSSLANYEISFSYFMAKDYKNAEKFSKKVIDLHQDNLMSAYINYANSLDMQGRVQKAILTYEKAMKDFDHYLLYYNHAMTCLNAGQTDKAFDSALKAISNNPSHASSHLLLSSIMKEKGSRVKAMLPLYYFLYLEPNSARAKSAYETLQGYIAHGVTKDSETKINVVVPRDRDNDFGAAEMMISLSKASSDMEENKGKNDIELFAYSSNQLFSILGELKKDQSGIWWDFYIPFFYEIVNQKLTTEFCYYIAQSKGTDAKEWFDKHPQELDRLKTWGNQKK